MPLVAFDNEAVGPLIFGAIALVGWIINKLKERDKPGGLGEPQVGGGGQVQAEIDKFLQQVRGGGAAGGRQEPPAVLTSSDAFESPEPATRPRLVQQTTRRPASPGSESGPRKSLADRHVIGDRHIDSGVAGHVVDHIPGERMDGLVEQDLGDGVSQSVSAHMGPGESTADVWVDTDQWTADNLVGLLSRPDGIRQAVLIQEILARPKARRGRSGL